MRGYYYVSLTKNRKQYGFTIHRLVASTFISSPENCKVEINHKDGNKLNNHVSNLEWVTHKYNIEHAYSNGLINAYARKICQLDKNKNVIATFSSVKNASEKTKTQASHIIEVCKQKRQKANGWYWCYAEELKSFKENNKHNGNCKQIYQYKMERNTEIIVKKWESIADAAEFIGIDRSVISRACKNLSIVGNKFP